jgi:hypothetical protein
MKFFEGSIDLFDVRRVLIREGDPDSPDAVILKRLRHVPYHSQDGFSWGDPGDGSSADLAMSLCCQVMSAGCHHPMLYQFVKRELIAPLDPDLGWEIPLTRVLDSIARAGGRAGSGLGQVRL